MFLYWEEAKKDGRLIVYYVYCIQLIWHRIIGLDQKWGRRESGRNRRTCLGLFRIGLGLDQDWIRNIIFPIHACHA